MIKDVTSEFSTVFAQAKVGDLFKFTGVSNKESQLYQVEEVSDSTPVEKETQEQLLSNLASVENSGGLPSVKLDAPVTGLKSIVDGKPLLLTSDVLAGLVFYVPKDDISWVKLETPIEVLTTPTPLFVKYTLEGHEADSENATTETSVEVKKLTQFTPIKKFLQLPDTSFNYRDHDVYTISEGNITVV